ncbi:MAG: glycosyltransferase family 2 protein [Burkholderiales bacterium]|nr:glycosyltransferase family 2 protein [Burkholderiales bacterium]
MDISVVICTRNRGAALGDCLRSVFGIDYPGDWEIIVVDNGSGDDTPQVIDRMARLSPVPFRSLVELRPGNSAGRNAAIGAARGDIVFFTDDDCIVRADVLGEVRRVFADRPDTGYAGGRILRFNPRDYPISVMEQEKAIDIRPGSVIYPGLVQGSNMAFRRRVLTDLGGFDPLFGAGAVFAGEEMELATRASLRGWRGGYFPGPTVYHNHGRDRAAALRLERQYDRGIGACYGKLLCDARTRWIGLLTWCRRALKQLFRHPSGLPRQLAGAISYARTRGDHA